MGKREMPAAAVLQESLCVRVLLLAVSCMLQGQTTGRGPQKAQSDSPNFWFVLSPTGSVQI